MNEALRTFDLQFKSLVAGIDEAGRGPLAGPLVVSLVVLDLNKDYLYINDSKKLSAKQRQEAYLDIIAKCLYYDIEVITPQVIDKINILEATKLGMKNLICRLPDQEAVVLVDHVKLELNQVVSITKGDAKSLSIAAASIIAKVTRDTLMLEYDRLYPEYGFKHHKGYPTKKHYQKIKEYGILPCHRLSYRLK